MTFPDLQSYLARLRAEGDLAVIDAPCSPRLEIPEIHRRVVAAGGPALLFRRPEGADFPVVTNLFGTRRRVERAFGTRPLRFLEGIADLVREPPLRPGALWARRGWVRQALRVGFRRERSSPVTEVIRRPPELSRLPLLHCWKEDGGAFVTLGLVETAHPDSGTINLGVYRMQRHDDATTGMHWQIGKGGGFHYAVAEERGRPLPITVYLGGPPALILAAIAPLPENVPELLLASLLLGERMPRTRHPAAPRPLVASAEMAIVGHVPPQERRLEGPFGDHYGYLSLRHEYPVFRVDAILHRRDAIVPATVVGKPRQEDFFLGDYLQELLAPLFPLVMPGVRGLWSYGETGFHALSAAVVTDRYPREAMASAFRILGEGQLSLTKFLLLTDRRVDLRDPRAVFETILARFRPETDLYIFSNLSMDTLDYTGPAVNRGSKGVMLGLGDPVRELPRVFEGTLPFGCRRAEVWCGGCLVVDGPPYGKEPDLPLRLRQAFPGWPLVVLVDDAAEATRTDARFLWTTFTRFEPAADVHAMYDVRRHHLSYRGTIVVDARKKPNLPPELFCDPDTAAMVTRRWSEYFPSGGVAMGDSDAAGLG